MDKSSSNINDLHTAISLNIAQQQNLMEINALCKKGNLNDWDGY